jgi:hypothetical protein
LEISADAFAVAEPTGAAELKLGLKGGIGTERMRVRRTWGSL